MTLKGQPKRGYRPLSTLLSTLRSRQGGELLTIFLLLAGAVASSFTLRAAGNYVNLYQALGNLEVRTLNETYSLGPEDPSVFLTIQIRNPTPYEGLGIEGFYFTPKHFQSPTTNFTLGFDTYSLKSVSSLQDVILPGWATLDLKATVVINSQAAPGFLQFYQNQTLQPRLVYEASFRIHSMLDGYCAMRLYLEQQGSRFTCRPGNFGI